MLREILNDPDRKSLVVIIREIIVLFFRYGEIPVHYFTRYLFKKQAGNIMNFVPNGLAGKIAPSFNDSRLKQVLDNKLYFSMYYSQFGVSTPNVVAFNHNNLFASGGLTTTLKSVNAFRGFLLDLFKQNPDCDTLFIKKLYSSSSGRNVHVIEADKVIKDEPLLNDIFHELTSSEFVIQEKVKQHPEMVRLNPDSLNTMRIDTFLDREGNIEIISAFLKMSVNGLPVDNNTTGGYGVSIDMKTGRLRKNGYSKIKVSGVGILTEHPLTHVEFEGFEIPMFAEALELATRAAGLMPGLRLVGWDVGISEKGPVLVEGNSDYGINSNDLMYGGYMANEKFRKVLAEYKSR